MAFCTSIQLDDIESMIKSALNAAGSFGGDVTDKRRQKEVIEKSRVYGTLEVIRAIARNPQHGLWGAYAAKVSVDHDAFLPAHVGVHGVPLIVPYAGGNERIGILADPDEIDDYRNDTIGQFSDTAHDQTDDNFMPSEVSGFWSIVNKQLKFTGYSARVPLIQITEEEVAAKTPVEFMPTIVKLAPLWNLKEGDNLVGIAAQLVAAGQKDLAEIEAGAMSVPPVSDVMQLQKEL